MHAGTKSECLDHIEKVWVDMRPKSLRDALDALPESEKFHGINWEYMKEIEEARKNADPNVDQFNGTTWRACHVRGALNRRAAQRRSRRTSW